MKSLIIVIIFSLANFRDDHSPARSGAVELAGKIFDKESGIEIKAHITGEYTGSPSGKDLQKGAVTSFVLLEETDKKAAVSMAVRNPGGEGLDAYLFFVKDSIWKMSAFRSFQMARDIVPIQDKLERLKPHEVDAIIKSAKNKRSKKKALFSSREEYEFLLGNTRLTLESDEKIVRYLIDNKQEFERIKDSVYKLSGLSQKKRASIGEAAIMMKPAYRKLFISSIRTGCGNQNTACLNFLICESGNNAVGYLYSPDKSDLPSMDPDGIIMLREIGDGWYAYKSVNNKHKPDPPRQRNLNHFYSEIF